MKEKTPPLYPAGADLRHGAPAERTGENDVIDLPANPDHVGGGIKATGEGLNDYRARNFIMGRPYGGA